MSASSTTRTLRGWGPSFTPGSAACSFDIPVAIVPNSLNLPSTG
ncbi:hypothetical protein [Streptomyces sp. NBC_00083]|nr:hypothetical protein [Streptomyces sp. NBC_00083]MCX5387991.1 hypothetical protein [Streptomyces sp. NBC_00083]